MPKLYRAIGLMSHVDGRRGRGRDRDRRRAPELDRPVDNGAVCVGAARALDPAVRAPQVADRAASPRT